jgi:hypothetical protein
VSQTPNGETFTTREFCGRCHRLSPVGFHATPHIWRAVAGRWMHDILCLTCFTTLGDEKGIQWEIGMDFYPVSFFTHQEMKDESLMKRLRAANPAPGAPE